MNLAIALVHNKGSLGNEAQIVSLLKLVEKKIETFIDPDTGEEQKTHYYRFKDLNLEHRLKMYQIVPYGVDIPTSYNLLDSHKVIYGEGDVDKSDTRFFNWFLKRSTDYGADVIILADNVSELTPVDMESTISALHSKLDTLEYKEHDCGKLTTLRLLKDVGQLDEKKVYNDSLTDLKNRITAKGFTYG